LGVPGVGLRGKFRSSSFGKEGKVTRVRCKDLHRATRIQTTYLKVTEQGPEEDGAVVFDAVPKGMLGPPGKRKAIGVTMSRTISLKKTRQKQ